MTTTSSYTVTGMTCSHCAAAVTEELSRIPDVQDVDVDVSSGRVTVTSGMPLDDQAVRTAVAEAGYELQA